MIEKRIEFLRKEIKQRDISYEKNKPTITDSEYDKLYMELEKLESENPEFYDENSPTQKITTSIISRLDKVTHSTPMLSLDKETEVDGILEFAKEDVLIQEKLDGITVITTYENGELVRASSRGNGEVGEDITHTVKCFENVPKTIPYKGRLEVRSEAIMPYVEFEKANIDGRYSNPRNFASGQIRRLDNSGIKELGLKIIAFDLVFCEKEFEKDTEMLAFLEEQGFEIVASKLFKANDIEGIERYVKEYEKKRENLPHMIDGLVVKFNDLALRRELGTTSKHPKWAIAYKFASLDAMTKLLDITWQVGKQGQITPVAELQTVEIDNVNISRATLHNFGNIKTKDIRINDTVIVKRANDVIPYIVGSVVELRDHTQKKIDAPTYCPACGETAEFEGENLFCIGLECTPQIEGKIKHFASRDAMNIDGLGGKSVELFLEKGIIKSIADIYNLKNKEEDIISLERFGKKKFDKIVEGVEASKGREFHHFLYSLSIKNIGRSASKDLANKFESIDDLLNSFTDLKVFRERLLSIEGFGDTMADSLVSFLMHQKNIDTIKIIQSYGVNMVSDSPQTMEQESEIKGKRFVVTGKVEHFKNRNELSKTIEDNGGIVSGSVSKNTDYLINNDILSSSSKNKRANELGVPIISEKDFLEMIM